MNLERGEKVYYRLLQLDMFGIWMSQSFGIPFVKPLCVNHKLFRTFFKGALPFVTASVFCMNNYIKWLTIGSYCLFCLWGLQKALTATSPWQRRLCFALPFLMRVLLTILRLSKLAGGNAGAMTHVFLQDGVSIFGGAIGTKYNIYFLRILKLCEL